MNIEISKVSGKDQKQETTNYHVLSYKTVASPEGLLLVSEGTMSDIDDTQREFLEIKKVQFIASCKTDFTEEPLLVAFYLGEGGDLSLYILSTLQGNYFQRGERFILIDYKSYLDICEYTGETKLSITEYIRHVRSSTMGTNSLLGYEGKLLNYDEQNRFYEETDKAKENIKLAEA